MNIQSVANFDAAVSQLNAIKGDVTADQLSDLTELFSTNIWNTSDAEGTNATLDRQIRDLKALLDEIQAQIDELYNQQKNANEEMNGLVNDLNQESYQASKQADRNVKEQQDLVSAATDEAYNKYMKGDIEKEEIPLYIASALAKSNAPGGAAMESHLTAMDAKGQKITNLSNKIANMLDSLNEFKAKYKTTEASLGLLEKLKAMAPKHKERADIQQTTQRPYYSPSQEAMCDKFIDKFKVAAGGGDKNSSANPAVVELGNALNGSGTVVDETRKAELDAMTPEAKAAAVEEADLSKYSALELMYISGMDATQAAYAIHHIFGNANIGYNAQNGRLSVPYGHDGASTKIYDDLVTQYGTLWGETDRDEKPTDKPETPVRTDPIGWREGDTNFLFTIDRDGDNQFDGPEEFVGFEQGWAEMTAADANKDGTLTADEMTTAGFRVMEANQALTNGGTYGWNGVKESGVESINLSSYKEIEALKAENVNGNTRNGEFQMTVNGKAVLGKQTENAEAYNDLFYGHTYNEAYSYGLDPDEVAETLAKAAEPQDYMAIEKIKNKSLTNKAKEIIEDDQENITDKTAEAVAVRASASENTGAGLQRTEEAQDGKETDEIEAQTKKEEEEIKKEEEKA